ncbi:MAG: Na+/H+ antiporter NhaA [Salinivirgaceae bacterium]|jgi:NhaA family Na+:H+ antiporter|nr:Na+/H+ antiporter NhaA [Salinivirgaceae bacterium]
MTKQSGLSWFLNNEKSGGLMLICCTVVSLLLANSAVGEEYAHFWHIDLGGLSLTHWINDGLMMIFFLLIGLELKREMIIGKLSNVKDAMLPIFAAIGGMAIPAGIYFAFNAGTVTQSGIGIPMATDIAFALGVLSLLGSRVPLSLKIFLTALAVIDDLGAILVIAVFYTSDLVVSNLFIALGVFALLLVLNKLKVRNLIPYLIGGAVMWVFMLNSGVHATITGVLLAFTIPFGPEKSKNPSLAMEHWLHKPVTFLILPIFATANTAIIINSGLGEMISQNYSLGIAAGLILGKPIGVFLVSLLAVSLGLCTLPKELNWKTIIGVGFLAGIGFTMSIFITLLAFNDATVIDNSKLMILLASLAAGIIGFIVLNINLRKLQKKAE